MMGRPQTRHPNPGKDFQIASVLRIRKQRMRIADARVVQKTASNPANPTTPAAAAIGTAVATAAPFFELVGAGLAVDGAA